MSRPSSRDWLLDPASKHFAVLLASGIVLRSYGGNHKIDPRFLVPGERAIDIGHAYLRFD